MDQLSVMFTVIAAGLLLSASPGPSMAYVLSRSVQFGSAGGLASSLGLAVGGMLHALFAALGLSLVAVKFPWLLQVIKYLGAAYLAYLAYDSLRAAFESETQQASTDVEKTESQASTNLIAREAYWRLFLNGVLIELSNPKTIIFFLSFMPQFVHQHSAMGMFFLSSLIPITAIPADLLAIFAGGIIASRVRSHYWLVRAINIAVAVVLLGIAAMVLFLD
ncbi:LysE family translocator [Undibacterium flavidum]|uniref:LysE family translocator n=1 Tax=Undibacterium flavidum TaxID=2762297 RepID=A0ABR6Y6Y6_9BURK|nr:LysE family translocator [Undibacterium flavidum]MBC3872369.1 LysE family translocator [Undibacterium flavidum]